MIILDMFLQGFFLLGFDLTPDMSADERNISLPLQGNVRFETRFKSALPEPVTCIFYPECPRNFEIDNSRNVTAQLRTPLRLTGSEQTSKLFSRSISYLYASAVISKHAM
jgi:hypothetical protein